MSNSTGLAAVAALGVLAAGAAADPEDQTVFTDFEGISASDFSIGPAGQTASFGGDAFSAFLGVPELYFSGLFAWMVDEGGTGVVTFESPAATVEFWVRTNPTAAPEETTLIEVFEGEEVIASDVIVNDGWNLASYTGAITRIEVTNNDVDELNAVDDFGYTPAPLPPACPEDLSGDGSIDSADLNQLLAAFGASADGDIDGDGATDSADLNLLLAVFGDDCP